MNDETGGSTVNAVRDVDPHLAERIVETNLNVADLQLRKLADVAEGERRKHFRDAVLALESARMSLQDARNEVPT